MVYEVDHRQPGGWANRYGHVSERPLRYSRKHGAGRNAESPLGSFPHQPTGQSGPSIQKRPYPVIHIDESRCQKEVIEINGAYGIWGSVNFKTYQNGYDTFYWGEYAGFQPIESILWDEAMPIIYGEYPS